MLENALESEGIPNTLLDIPRPHHEELTTNLE
jgi:hypothetical protein